MMAGIMISYMVLIFCVGIWANKFNKGAEDYLLAGRRLGLWLGSFAITANFFGGGLSIGMSQLSFSNGFVVIWNGIGTSVGLILVGIMAFKMREMAFYTIADYLGYRYGNDTIRVIAAILSLVALIGILGAQVGACGNVLKLVGINSQYANIIALVLMVIYTAIGGLWAATITDFIHIIVAFAGLAISAVLLFPSLGGIGGMIAKLNQAGVDSTYTSLWGTGDVPYMLWLFVPIMLYTLIGQDLYQRIFATKDANTARLSCCVAGIFIFIIVLFPVFIGMGARALFPGLADSGQALPMILKEILPTAVGGICLAAIMAAILSTANSILTAATSHVINDIYMKTIYKGREVDQKKMLTLSRLWTVAIGLGAILLAFLVPEVITLCIMSYTLYTGGVFIPIVGGFLWKRATLKGAFASLIIGVIISVLGIRGVSFAGIETTVFSNLICLPIFVIVSLLTYKKEEPNNMNIAN